MIQRADMVHPGQGTADGHGLIRIALCAISAGAGSRFRVDAVGRAIALVVLAFAVARQGKRRCR